MNHLELGALESLEAMGTHSDRDWERWLKRGEEILGANTDGDGDDNGYSLDEAYDFWLARKSPEQYYCMVKARTNFVRRTD